MSDTQPRTSSEAQRTTKFETTVCINHRYFNIKINYVGSWRALYGKYMGDNFEVVIHWVCKFENINKLMHHSEGNANIHEAIADKDLWCKMMSEGKLNRFPTF